MCIILMSSARGGFQEQKPTTRSLRLADKIEKRCCVLKGNCYICANKTVWCNKNKKKNREKNHHYSNHKLVLTVVLIIACLAADSFPFPGGAARRSKSGRAKEHAWGEQKTTATAGRVLAKKI